MNFLLGLIIICFIIAMAFVLKAKKSYEEEVKILTNINTNTTAECEKAQNKLVETEKELKNVQEKLSAFTLTYSELDNKYSKLEKAYNQLVEDTADLMKTHETDKIEKSEKLVKEEKPVAVETVEEPKKVAKKTTTKKATTKKTSKKK